MEYIFLFLVTLGVYSISIISTAESGICISKGVIYCCQDFKNISGECRACIGTFGQNCSNPCMYGYYGHGCRKRCNCSQKQFCDREKGCLFANDTYLSIDQGKEPDTKATLQSITLATCGVLIFIVSGIVFYLHRKL
ncbi:cell death abnormality protein 1-like isoform X3 [Saccostrea cucullata]|uniref:cell death abnormality protein 1-like isoform X3 n=1 Tax=Saccostrea cuccullata TaxID=36930 RepID=UPI002ED16338